MSVKTLLTAEEFLEVATSTPCELVRGEVVEYPDPGDRHRYVYYRVLVMLSVFAEKSGIEIGYGSGVVVRRYPDTVRRPDCQYFSAGRLPEGYPERGYPVVPPDLVIEVPCEFDNWTNIVLSVSEYLRVGVAEIWIVDPDVEKVFVFRDNHSPRHLDLKTDLVSDLFPRTSCPVASFFAGIDRFL